MKGAKITSVTLDGKELKAFGDSLHEIPAHVKSAPGSWGKPHRFSVPVTFTFKAGPWLTQLRNLAIKLEYERALQAWLVQFKTEGSKQ